MSHCHGYHHCFFNQQDYTKYSKVLNELRQLTGRNSSVFLSPHQDVAFSVIERNQINISRHFLAPHVKIDKFAGILAHEWGHIINPNPRVTLEQRRQHEYDADEFAARFLAHHGYEIEPLIEFCTRGPTPIELYGTHTERANHLRDAYYRNLFPQLYTSHFTTGSMTFYSTAASNIPMPKTYTFDYNHLNQSNLTFGFR